MAQSKTPKPAVNYTFPVNEGEPILMMAYASSAGFVHDLYNDRVLTAPQQRTAVEIQARIAEASKPKKKELRKHDPHAMLDLEERKVETPPPLPARPVELP